jgi:hypothetical protein
MTVSKAIASADLTLLTIVMALRCSDGGLPDGAVRQRRVDVLTIFIVHASPGKNRASRMSADGDETRFLTPIDLQVARFRVPRVQFLNPCATAPAARVEDNPWHPEANTLKVNKLWFAWLQAYGIGIDQRGFLPVAPGAGILLGPRREVRSDRPQRGDPVICRRTPCLTFSERIVYRIEYILGLSTRVHGKSARPKTLHTCRDRLFTGGRGYDLADPAFEIGSRPLSPRLLPPQPLATGHPSIDDGTRTGVGPCEGPFLRG